MTGKAETGPERVDEALEGIRKAVERQLGVERPPPARVDHASLVRFSNDLLVPPPPHVLATFEAAQANPVVAHRFAHVFNDNSGLIVGKKT